MAIAKRGQDHIKERGNNLLNNFKEQYSNQEEATARACNASCTTSYNALCGDVKDACSTGETTVPLFPGRSFTCSAAKNAVCSNKPTECIVDCFRGDGSGNKFHGNDPAYYASLGYSGTPQSMASWKEICIVGCATLATAAAVTVTAGCVAGTLWSFGGILIPCEYAVAASWIAAAEISAVCSLRCGGG
jgi:hypothetical protein